MAIRPSRDTGGAGRQRVAEAVIFRNGVTTGRPISKVETQFRGTVTMDEIDFYLRRRGRGLKQIREKL